MNILNHKASRIQEKKCQYLKAVKWAVCSLMAVSPILFFSCNQPTFRIFEKPVIFDEKREQLTIEYLNDRHGIMTNSPVIVPEMIIVHWSPRPVLEENFELFKYPDLSARPDIAGASRLNVSVHFLVDRDGTIFRLLPDSIMGRHTIGLNYMSLRIENIGSASAPLTRAQVRSNVALIRHLASKHNIKWLIGHHEYSSFQDSDLWKETDPDYITHRTGPGDRFMNRLRKRLSDLELKAKP